MTTQFAIVDSSSRIVSLHASREIVRTDEAWWSWHDGDSTRWSQSTGEAESRCAAWVAGESDDGPKGPLYGHDRELVQLIAPHDVGDVIEYSARGVELADVSDWYLYDSSTAEVLTAEELGLTDEQYESAKRASRDCGQWEGHIRLESGRLVYAAI